MLKKMMLLALSVGALMAFAVPTVAQADVQLTDVNGEPVSGEITATALGTLVTTVNHPTPFPRLECGNVTLHMNVLTNGLEHVELEQIGEATTSGCALNLNGTTKLPASITDGTVGALTIDTWGEGSATSTFVSDVPAAGLANCRLEGDVNVLATDGTDILDVEPSLLTKEEGSGEGCSNSGTIEGSFTLENNLGPLTIDAVNTP